MRTIQYFAVKYEQHGAIQFTAPTLEEAKALLIEKCREMRLREDISEENRTYWLKKYADATFLQRIEIESEVQ